MKRTIFNPIQQDTLTFVQTAAETAGQLSELGITMLPGGGNALHYHTTYTETFTAITGTLGLELEKKRKLLLTPGESYVIKLGEVHRFFNPGDTPITFRNVVLLGHEGFENTLRILYGLAADGLYNEKGLPKSIMHLAVCAIMSDTRLPGLGNLLTPVFRLLASFARWQGIEAQLLDRYCR
ncbi:cupin domain-containing protein [Hymenobacter sp. GOD-10R]|uniref:cupin domain-containing protein n=1 Tax=Hymenobacter sp. GOD-10R TaxID=3093922 RepID=UPI002D76F036|nr:cupin domain-containing protein [Hymenobacter sp. GOD-10R]WRQ30649.1 cupin domain-containing protein [Hymenobacter sp. GOD-10R]